MQDHETGRAGEALRRLRAALGEGTSERLATMELVRAKRLVTERDKQLAVRVDELLEGIASRFDPTAPDGEGNRIEARALLVVGESGAGKTWTLRRHFREHPAFPGYGVPGSDCPLVTVPVKPPCTLMALGHQTCAATGYPIGARLEAHRVWDRVYQRLADRGIFGVHFDEMHNFILTANKRDRRDVQNMLKTLMTNPSWPVFVVVSGLPVVQEFVEEACEDRRRMRVVHFAPLSAPDHNGRIAAMLRELAGVAGLGLDAATGDRVVPRLMHAALFALGTSIELMHEAIDDALRKDRRILETENFANAYAARTGSLADANPFLAANWAELDCSRVLMRDADTRSAPFQVTESDALGSKKGSER